MQPYVTLSPGGRAYTDEEIDRFILQRVTAEQRAEELVEALKAAIAGAPHWRAEAQALLRLIDGGVLPEPQP